MTKEINFRMTNACARLYGYESRYSLCLVPVEVSLDSLSEDARWIAEHITATYILDEYRDRNRLVAIAGFSMAERDRKNGMPEADVQSNARAYGDFYTDPMECRVTFPIYANRKDRRAEKVIEEAVYQLREAGAVALVDRATGDRHELAR